MPCLPAGRGLSDTRESNTLDGAAPFYCSYRCSDGGFITIAPLEPQFYELFLKLMDISDEVSTQRHDRSKWPLLKEHLAQRFASRPRDAWCQLLEGTDVCFAPVLNLAEAPLHPHNRARKAFAEVAGAWQPAPAPRFSRTVSELPPAPCPNSEAANEVLLEAGLDRAAIDALRAAGVVQL